MRQDYSEFRERHAEVIAIGADSATSFRDYWEKERIPFPALPDPDKRVLEQLGQEFSWLRLGRLPAVIVVDMDGTIKRAHYGDSASDIPENREILDLLDEMNTQRSPSRA